MQNAPILGILGGGQLGQMFTYCAQRMGFAVCVFCPEERKDSPAAHVAHHHIQANYDDEVALDAFAAMCCGISTEFENVPQKTLRYLESLAQKKHLHLRIAPRADAVAIAQNRVREKSFFQQHNIPTTAFWPLGNAQNMADIHAQCPLDFFPAVLKTNTLGYDGKGQVRVAHIRDLEDAWQALGQAPCIVEKWQSFDHEISVIIARDFSGHSVYYPAAYNVHRDGILHYTQVPSPKTSKHSVALAEKYALEVAHALDYVGILCVEFFVLPNGEVVANEMAPRPHNSGHYTQNACFTSQFAQQVRILAGLKLGDASLQTSAAAMVNIMGDACLQSPHMHTLAAWQAHLDHSMDLHWYHKTPPKMGRKMGHINLAGSTQAIEAGLQHLLKIL